MDLSIIIVNWNSADYVRQCLRSIYGSPQGIEFEVLVVDSGSFDTCGTMIGAEFPQATFIQSKENIGFARSNNLALERARGRNILFLNPDTEVLGRALAEMCAWADKLPNVGTLGCKILNADRTLQTSCVQAFPTLQNQLLNSEFLRKRFPKSHLWGVAALFNGSDRPAPVEMISGACTMMKREICLGVQGFSTEYFMYFEDMDLSFKTHLRGLTNYYVPSVSIIHYGDGSVNRARSHFAIVMAADALRRFFHKHRGAGYAGIYRLSMVVASLIRLSLLNLGLLVRPSHVKESIQRARAKWFALFRWSVGRERWVLDYK